MIFVNSKLTDWHTLLFKTTATSRLGPVVHSLVPCLIAHERQVARHCLCPTGQQTIRAATYEYLQCVCERRMAICCLRSLPWATKGLLKSR